MEKLLWDPLRQLRNVPKRFRQRYAEVITTILDYVEESHDMNHIENNAELNRALKWQLAVHRLFLRQAVQKKKKGFRTVSAAAFRKPALDRRFKMWDDGDYQGLVKELLEDLQNTRPSSGKVDNSESAIKQRAHEAAADGDRKKAQSYLNATNKGIAPLTGPNADPRVIEQLNEKNPVRQENMPGHLTDVHGNPLDKKAKFERINVQGQLFRKFRRLLPNKGRGPSGNSNAYLKAQAQHFDSALANRVIPMHEWFAELYLNGDLPKWYYYVTSAVTMIALIKPAKTPLPEGDAPDVRPVAMGEVWRRAVVSCAVGKENVAIGASYEGIQVAVGVKDASPKLLTLIRATLEANPNFVVVKIDLRNAYNEAHRAAVLQSLLDNPATRKFARYFHASMSPKSRMFGIGVLSETGVQQGAPDATFEFTQVIHQDVVELHRVVTEAGGACCFYSDDGYVVGPPEIVFPALKQFQTSLFARTNLELVEDKCEVYSKHPAIARDYLSKNPEFGKFNLGALPDVDTTEATAGAGYGIKILGVPVGDLRYIETILTNKVTSIREDIFNSTRILDGCNLSESSDDSIGLEEPVNDEAETLTTEDSNRGADLQLLQNLLLVCLLPRFDYWLQNLPPHLTLKHAEDVDKIFLRVLDHIAGQEFTEMGEKSLIVQRIRLPVKLCGAGLDSKEAKRHASYAGTMIKVVRSLANKHDEITGELIPGFNHALWLKWCSEETDDETTVELKHFFDGRSRMGTHFKSAYEHTQFLAGNPQDAENVLSIKSEDLADKQFESVLRKPLKAFKSVLDTVRGKVVMEGMLQLPVDNTSRQAFIHTSVHMTSFLRASGEIRDDSKVEEEMTLLNAKRYENTLSDSCLRTMWAVWLGLKIKWLEPFIGQPIGKTGNTVDGYGGGLIKSQMCGDHWTKRHDKLKHFLYDIMLWAKMKCAVEVYDEFARFISTNFIDPAGVQAATATLREVDTRLTAAKEKNEDVSAILEEHTAAQVALDKISITHRQSYSGKPIRKQQGMVPDGSMETPTAQVGSKRKCLWEVKTLNGGGAYLTTSIIRRHAVAARAKAIQSEYQRKAVELDEKYNGFQKGQRGGPCNTHLESMGLVRQIAVGRFGEVSRHTMIIVKICADMIASNTWKYSGYNTENDARACIKNYITKRLSISCLRGVAVLLKDRFDMPGSIGVEGKQQKKSKNYTKSALYVAGKAMIEDACIHREARR